MKKEKTIIIMTPLGENTLFYRLWKENKKANEIFNYDKKTIGKDKFYQQYLGNFDIK